jgi:hypothetical protein
MPLVICGPILRRVDNNSVTVWVALREAQKVTLFILDSNYVQIGAVDENTLSFGQNLHIATITVHNQFTEGQLYFYNLGFDDNSSMRLMIESNGSLTDGILVNSIYSLPNGIAYKDYLYPSFTLPPNDLSYLKFLHGSCRKPHGGDVDALTGLDHILNETTRNKNEYLLSVPDRMEKLYERPQFLCLTGDQIYADDVADILLYMLMDAATAIMGWGDYENTISIEQIPDLTITRGSIKPGGRQKLVANKPNESSKDYFSTSEAKSHLVRLGEFYMMYLFTWSDVLWPDINDFPSFINVYGNIQTETPITYYGDGNFVTENFNTTEKKTYDRETPAITNFLLTLRKLRRALANMPTYMMIDDHDITDDWFLTKDWVDNTLINGNLTKRIILNGLSAFSVFQAWGNIPYNYNNSYPDNFHTGGLGRDILNNLVLINNDSSNLSSWYSLENLLLPTFSTSTQNDQGMLTSKLDFFFHIDFPKFRLIFLDTRTQRSYDENDGPPGLIYEPYQSNQLMLAQNTIPTNIELAIVISPAPFFGNLAMERLQKIVRNNVAAFLFGTFTGTKYAKGGMYFQDQEAWIFSRHTFESFLEKLSSYTRILILSGDVHYSYSNSIKYWNFRNGINKTSALAQLCCSSFKNSDKNTVGLSTPSFKTPKLYSEIDVLGWSQPGSHMRYIYSIAKDYQNGYPSMYELEFNNSNNQRDISLSTLYTPLDEDHCEWGYRIVFENDNRNINDREIVIPNGNEQLSSPDFLEQVHSIYHDILKKDEQRMMVGVDSIGLISVSDWPNKKIIHQLWYFDLDDISKFHPYTEHIVDLNLPDSNSIPLGKVN